MYTVTITDYNPFVKFIYIKCIFFLLHKFFIDKTTNGNIIIL